MRTWWDIVGPIYTDEHAQICATASAEVRRAFLPHIEESQACFAQAADALDRACNDLGL